MKQRANRLADELSAQNERSRLAICGVDGEDEAVTAALTAVTAAALVGLLAPPTRRHLPWARTACALLLLTSSALVLLTTALALTHHWAAALGAGVLATSVLFPVFWLARSPDAPPPPPDGHDDNTDEGGGGGPGPPDDPEPGPPAPSLDWDAFDEARQAWVERERELIDA